MAHTNLLLTLLSGAMLHAFLAQSQPQSGASAQTNIDHRSFTSLLKEKNSLASVVQELAVERFTANEAKGNSWILGLQGSSINVVKFSDTNTTVILLPWNQGDYGLELFVAAYDRLVLRFADRCVAQGDLRTAERLYRLLQKFAPADFYPKEINARLTLLQAAREGKTANIKETIDAIEPSFDPFALIAKMETQQPVTVTNLLSAGKHPDR